MANVFKQHNFIERSLKGVLIFFKDSILSAEQSSYHGFLQSLDARFKAATFLLLCIAALITRNIYALGFLYFLTLILVAVSKINLGFFLKRTWVFIPLFSLFIAIPAALMPHGLPGAVLFVSRVTVSVSLVVLLGLTTRHFVLLRVLRIFKVPQIFVMVLGMSYRYIYLFMEIVENTYLGIKSRTGGLIHYKKGQSLVAWNIAQLWQRSFQLNEDVYSAMLSRGYTGEPVLLDDFRASVKDWAWAGFALFIFCGVVILKNG